MKNLQILSFALMASLFFASCSSDDDDDNSNEPLVGNYFPSTQTNIWNYDVDNTSSTDPDLNFTDAPDFVSIATTNGSTFTVNVNNGGNANGIMNEILSNGTLTLGSSTLAFNGELDFLEDLQGLSDETISLQNILLYDLNASNNTVMSEVSDTIDEIIDLNGTDIPVTINYTIESKKLGLSNSMNVGGETFSNVAKTSLTLNLDIFASVDILGGENPIDYAIISDQNVYVIENYFAENVGLIKSEAVVSYNLAQQFIDLLALIPNNELDISESYHVINEQEIDSYLVN